MGLVGTTFLTMRRKILISLLAVFLITSVIDARVRIRRIGPDYRTEEQKQKDKEEGMTFGIIVAIVIGGLVIWGKMRNK